MTFRPSSGTNGKALTSPGEGTEDFKGRQGTASVTGLDTCSASIRQAGIIVQATRLLDREGHELRARLE